MKRFNEGFERLVDSRVFWVYMMLICALPISGIVLLGDLLPNAQNWAFAVVGLGLASAVLVAASIHAWWIRSSQGPAKPVWPQRIGMRLRFLRRTLPTVPGYERVHLWSRVTFKMKIPETLRSRIERHDQLRWSLWGGERRKYAGIVRELRRSDPGLASDMSRKLGSGAANPGAVRDL